MLYRFNDRFFCQVTVSEVKLFEFARPLVYAALPR